MSSRETISGVYECPTQVSISGVYNQPINDIILRFLRNNQEDYIKNIHYYSDNMPDGFTCSQKGVIQGTFLTKSGTVSSTISAHVWDHDKIITAYFTAVYGQRIKIGQHVKQFDKGQMLTKIKSVYNDKKYFKVIFTEDFPSAYFKVGLKYTQSGIEREDE